MLAEAEYAQLNDGARGEAAVAALGEQRSPAAAALGACSRPGDHRAKPVTDDWESIGRGLCLTPPLRPLLSPQVSFAGIYVVWVIFCWVRFPTSALAAPRRCFICCLHPESGVLCAYSARSPHARACFGLPPSDRTPSTARSSFSSMVRSPSAWCLLPPSLRASLWIQLPCNPAHPLPPARLRVAC